MKFNLSVCDTELMTKFENIALFQPKNENLQIFAQGVNNFDVNCLCIYHVTSKKIELLQYAG